MIIRFGLFILFIACIVFSYRSIFTWSDKRTIKAVVKNVLIAIVIAFAISIPLFFLNNISGV